MKELSHWALWLCCVVLLCGALFAPSRDGSMTFMSTQDSLSFLLSLPVLCCTGLTIIGFLWIRRQRDVSEEERSWALWHLTNATWWSFGCDVLSGLFGIVPILSRHYETIDIKHTDPTKRSGLDAVYLCELFVHVPTAWIVFYGYGTRAPWTRTLESFLCGVQIIGTVAYYLPEFLDGSENYPKGGIALWFGVYFGLLWIVLPFAILLRNVQRDIRENARKVS